MGRQEAVDALRLLQPASIPSVEVLEHPAIVHKVSGIDPYENPVGAYLKALPLLGIDWVIEVPQKAVRFGEGQSTIVGEDGIRRTEWGCGGSPWEEEHGFTSVEEVLAYRPLEDEQGRVRVVSRAYRDSRIQDPRRVRALAGDAVLVSGIYYTTLFQFGIMAFGWENFLTAAALDPSTFGVILDQFAQISVQNVEEWVRDDCPLLFFHDDLAITRGLVFPPEWYRREIFPRYERILEPARRAGRIMVFVSDGRFQELIPDLMALGIDGVMIDSSNDLAWVLEHYGRDHSVMGNIDTQILTRGNLQEIRAEVERCALLGRRYPGYFFKASGDLPHNIPLASLEYYFQLKRELGERARGAGERDRRGQLSGR
jgi:hypothetical protein